MDTIASIQNLLLRIANHMILHNEPRWAKTFEGFAQELKDSPAETKREIRSIYAGMGSFNDVILHDDFGIPLRDENSELAELRSALFKLCQEEP